MGIECRTRFTFGRAALACSGILLAAVISGCGGTQVEATRPKTGEIVESFTEPGRTRLSETYPITMPVTGRIGRIMLEPGDKVAAGQELVKMDLVPFEEGAAEARELVAEMESEVAVKADNSIENTLLAEARVLITAAHEVLKASDEQIASEQARSDRASLELARKKDLFAQKSISQGELDDAALDAETALIEISRQKFLRAATDAFVKIAELAPETIQKYIDLKRIQKESLTHRLMQAKSRLARAEHEVALASVASPLDGVVLERHHLGDAMLAAGTPLLLLGNLSDMEVEADVLTRDALALEVGGPVFLGTTVGKADIPGKVKQVEPAGFTKLSSLGVEQQRVKVVISFDRKDEGLGVGYRVEARFVTGSRSDALKVPRWSVLEAPDRTFYVFKIVEGRLKRQAVTLGLRSDLELEVTGGLSESDSIVARPDPTMTDGMRVAVRPPTE